MELKTMFLSLKASFFYEAPSSVEWMWAITFAVSDDASL